MICREGKGKVGEQEDIIKFLTFNQNLLMNQSGCHVLLRNDQGSSDGMY